MWLATHGEGRRMKKLIIALLLVFPLPVFADSIFSGNIAISSDYVWRGYSQNKNNPAISIGANAEFKGLTLGVWASDVDFNDEAKYEYDLMLDYSHDFNESFGISTGLIQYKWDRWYDDVDEAYVGITLKDLGVTYYKDLDNSDLDFINVVYELSFTDKVDLSLEYGKATGFDSYQALNISRDLGKFTIGGQIGTEETSFGLNFGF